MLEKGIYENIINEELRERIDSTESNDLVCLCSEVDSAESSQMLADYLAKVIKLGLERVENYRDRVDLANRVLEKAGLLDEGIKIVDSERVLTQVMTQQQFAMQQQAKIETIRPLSGFRVSNLFTGGSSTLSLGDEIRREIASADEIYFIVSFLKVSGVRILLDELKKFTQSGKHLKIITTTYCGATEAKAIKQISELPNTEIRISYNTDIERLHAKSYIFVRHSGLNTAYIGSSNLSKSAQTDGLEWNVRVTSIENPHIIKTALATFEQYWNSPNFEDFNIGGIEKFNKELNQNKISFNPSDVVYQRYILLPHQKQILDKLKVEREERNNYKNLVVAATGTGKTVISAFDYQNFVRTHSRSRILFIAHREEILKQSINTYRSVLEDINFGSLWVGKYAPNSEEDYEHIFVSISMFNSRFEDIFQKLGPDFYDFIVIDEAHHSQADSYKKLFSHFKPQILLGLTATPERMDGQDLRPDFGGRISAEIRLPQALQAGLLTPFQYFCVTDNVDLSGDDLWNGNKYNLERLADKLCNKERVRNIVDALRRYLANEFDCRALCFCVTKEHADFMAEQLRLYGFEACSLTSDTSNEARAQIIKDFRDAKIHYLCVVDIFNEGVDIPEIDTVLFLRPTESLTIFLQQLGRGLRLCVGKTELTVLDFVAQANKKYDFTARFRALSLSPDKNVKKQVEEGFAFLPHGCTIVMEKLARQYVLANINSAIYTKTRLERELRGYVDTPTISQFLESNGQDIRLLYKSSSCWTSLKRGAGKISYRDDDITKRLTKGVSNLIHHNTSNFLHFVKGFIDGTKDFLDVKNKRFALMLYYDLFLDKLEKTSFVNIYDALDYIHKEQYKYFKEEISEIVDYLLEKLSVKTVPLEGADFSLLELYGCYTREEIVTLLGDQTENRKLQGSIFGVYDLQNIKDVSLLFVTLNKSDADFSPTTQYDDYLINENYFHWQSKNTDSHTNNGGFRYIKQGENGNKIILFVRENKQDDFGNTAPFHCFGFIDYVSSHGDCPMNVTWKLEEPAMPYYLKTI